MTAAVTVPGKLYIAGEYAILRPGGAAILVAVDRTITARVRTGAAGPPASGTVTSEVTGGTPVPWHRQGTAVVLDEAHRGYAGPTAHVRAAIATADRYAAAHGGGDEPLALELVSQMTDGGVKLGLGSSGAVTVATVAAVLSARGVAASPGQVYRIAMLAAVVVDPHGSGGDLAAASHGGWVLYRSPDRARLRARLDAGAPIPDLVAENWPGHAVERLPAPRATQLRVGWTGTPASTAAHVAGLQGAQERDGHGLAEFYADSDRCVTAMAAALRSGDDAGFTEGVAQARGLLHALERRTGMGIVTEELEALCAGAEALGAVAKSSGAGGGDCGIAFVDSPAQRADLDASWRRIGVRPLELGPYDQPVEVRP